MTTPLEDQVGGRSVIVHFAPEHDSAWATGPDSEPIVGQTAFWFAWYAFNPETHVRLAADFRALISSYDTGPGAGSKECSP